MKGERTLMLEIHYELLNQRKNGLSQRQLAIKITRIVKTFLIENRLGDNEKDK